MNSLTKPLLFVLFSMLFAAAANADVSISVGTNSAGFYYNSVGRWHNNKINPNCAYVRRPTCAPGVDGIVFFAANTFDRRHRIPGSRIVVAVPEKRAHSFARKYGTSVRYRQRRHCNP